MRRLARTVLRTLILFFLVLNFILAMHAYKFTHFYDQGEVKLKPPQDKNGWDVTKDILFGFTFVKQKNTLPDTIVQTVYLTTQNGLKLEGWYLPALNPKGSVAMFHGHGGKKSSLNGEAKAFRHMGYNTLLMDFRAHGNSEGNTCTIGYAESEDVKLAYDYLQKQGEHNIILWGISLGAASITRSVDIYNLKPTKLILEMPFASMMDAVEGRLKIMGLPPQPIAAMLTFWGGVERGFWAYNLKPSEYVKQVSCPVLLQWGRNDIRVSHDETNLIYKNIPGVKQLEIYEQSGHESLYAKETSKWISTVTRFVNK